MKSLLVLAHGSRRGQSNDEVRQFVQAVREKSNGRYGTVVCAFLELTKPLISEGIDQCVKDGTDEIIILPYFLAAGRHVVEDIPAEVARKRAQYPGVTMQVREHIGVADALVDLVMAMADNTL